MDRQLNASAATSATRNVRLLGYPDECPRCHSKLVPRLIGTIACSLEEKSNIEEAFQCTNAKCGGLFIGVYPQHNLSARPPQYKFDRAIPIVPAKPTVSDLVVALSPAFYETYSQALIAESLGLTQLTGIGLRKALEFLVKDFAVSENPTQSDVILRKPLGACISDYLAEVNTREMAKRATWIGNDETHYVRRWESRDISDLKVLLRLTINGVENELLTKKYIADMPV